MGRRVIETGVASQPAAQEPRRRVRVIRNNAAGSKGGIPVSGCSPEELREVLTKHGLGNDVIETADEAQATAAVRRGGRRRN